MEDEFCRLCPHSERLHTGTLAHLRSKPFDEPMHPIFSRYYCIGCNEDRQGVSPTTYTDVHDWDPVVATEGGIISV